MKDLFGEQLEYFVRISKVFLVQVQVSQNVSPEMHANAGQNCSKWVGYLYILKTNEWHSYLAQSKYLINFYKFIVIFSNFHIILKNLFACMTKKNKFLNLFLTFSKE